ncbi:hypothetical protein D9615_002423 [Tricholomella constricta]|uniref:Integrase core domain-containing protein n=1 Tax=Tricholomella constricta TaxID=117010 RepID=A0A8H5HMM6_9AGAR|nr:hypothetical protein D9615_002423 [Tricholomella constricta]
MSTKSNNNPSGINQYKQCPPKDDPHTAAALQDYFKRNITNRKMISELLWTDHKIQLSEASVARRCKQLGLFGSGKTTREMSESDKRQLVLDQMSQDPTGRRGPRLTREAIIFNTGIHLTRKCIIDEMRLHHPEGFKLREPSVKKIKRGALTSLGPHHEWSADGHDKLSQIGFPIWGVRDKWSGKWLGLWVLPNNRYQASVGYLYLSLVVELGGMPLQSTTDCGSETVLLYGLAAALREHFAPELEVVEFGPAHRFLKSVYNITIERGWMRLRIHWGDNVRAYWEVGQGTIYNSNIPKQYELVQWLWPKLIQQELDTFRRTMNDHTVRADKNKKLPSGISPNIAISLCHKYGATNYLQPVDVAVVQQLMQDIGGAELIQFVHADYAARAQAAYDSLHISSLTFDNVWNIFQSLLPLM